MLHKAFTIGMVTALMESYHKPFYCQPENYKIEKSRITITNKSIKKCLYIYVRHSRTGSPKLTFVLRNYYCLKFHLYGYPQINTEQLKQNVPINGQCIYPGTCLWCSIKVVDRRSEGDKVKYHKVVKSILNICSY